METFEDYAKRVIAGLAPPEQISADQYLSPLEEPFSGLFEEDFPVIAVNPLEPQLDQIDLGNKLDTEQIEAIENGVLGTGIECLAFYKSIRYQAVPPVPGYWGIFIFDYAISYVAEEIESYYDGRFSRSNARQASLALLYFHERFHFRFDAWAVSQESATGKSLYENYRRSVYRSFHPLEYVYEETLANLHALSSIRSFGIYQFAKEFVQSQPGCYSNIRAERRQNFLGQLAAQLFYGRGQFLGVPHFRLPEHVGYMVNHNSAKRLDRECPAYLIQGFSPQRFSVPNVSLPAISEIESGFLRKYLAGEEIRTDHKYFRIDNGSKVKCPNPHSKTVKLREFKNITGKAGLRTSEYFDERKRTNGWKKGTPRSYPKQPLF
jgi:hypothetical protein